MNRWRSVVYDKLCAAVSPHKLRPREQPQSNFEMKTIDRPAWELWHFLHADSSLHLHHCRPNTAGQFLALNASAVDQERPDNLHLVLRDAAYRQLVRDNRWR